MILIYNKHRIIIIHKIIIISTIEKKKQKYLSYFIESINLSYNIIQFNENIYFSFMGSKIYLNFSIDTVTLVTLQK